MITTDYYLMLFSRFLSGMCQIVVFIYLPNFIDTFGEAKTKPIWMGYMLVSPPLGVIMGYGIAAVCVSLELSWRYSFVIIAIFMSVGVLMLTFTPADLINIDVMQKLKRENTNSDDQENTSVVK